MRTKATYTCMGGVAGLMIAGAVALLVGGAAPGPGDNSWEYRVVSLNVYEADKANGFGLCLNRWSSEEATAWVHQQADQGWHVVDVDLSNDSGEYPFAILRRQKQ